MPSKQAVYNSALAFTSCLCRAWRSIRGEVLVPSQVFPEHVPNCIQLWLCAWPSIFLGICESFSKPFFPKASNSLLLLPDLLVSLTFASMIFPCPRQQWLIHLNVFNPCSGPPFPVATSALGEFEVRQNKSKPFEPVLQEPPDRSKQTTTILWAQDPFCSHQ